MEITEPFFRINDWCASIGVSRSTVWRYIKNGEIPAPDFYIAASPIWTAQTRKRWQSAKLKNRKIS